MAVTVVGLWELGYCAPLNERDLWLFPLRDYQVDRWVMSPVSGIDEPELEEVADLADLEASGVRVFVDERAPVELSEFEHPEDAVYIFGRANYSPFRAMLRPGDLSVRIDTPMAGGLLWPHQVAVMVLRDRETKSWL